MRIIASSLSRILKHLTTGDYGVVSAYLDEYSLQENKERHSQLAKDIRAKGYGYIELVSKWEENGEVSDEQSFLVPKASKQDIINLGAKYEQFSVLSGTDGSTEHICTNRDKCGLVGKTLEVFKKGVLSQNDFQGAFSLLKKGSAGARNTRFKLLDIKESHHSHF